MTSWQNKCYSRLLIDSHITDQKTEYMRKFSSREYVRLVKLSGCESAMVYACDHNGNCYYPTRIGHQHANIAGRDIFGETITLLRRQNIPPIAYYTATYHNDCARRFPDAQVIDNVGAKRNWRFHFTCPNHPEAVDFYKEQIAEILTYDIDGIFIDMSFWPSICCCRECRLKFGHPFPEKIDWTDPDWIAFQRFRERSLVEFAQNLTDFIRDRKFGISVVHQFSPVLHGWYLGQSCGIADVSDYASGDFYGGKLQQRLAAKVFDAFTREAPFEFMTSRCVDLHDHTTSKSPDELELSALMTLANGGAYFFIDAIFPDGTLYEPFFRQLGEINRRLAPLRDKVRDGQARLKAEVGLYFSIACCVDGNINGTPLKKFDGGHADNMAVRDNAVLEEVLGTAEILLKNHIPFKVVPENGDDFSAYKAIIVNKVIRLT